MNKIKAILIDDEQKALDSLALKIKSNFNEIDIVASTTNPQDAIVLINKLQPQLVFIDIEMPVLSGFDVLSKIEIPNFELIFVTAYSQYALKAIKHCAIGYVLKPIDTEELTIAVQNAVQNINQKTAFEKNINLLEHLGVEKKITTLSVPTVSGLLFLKLKDIIRFEGIEGYTKIITIKGEQILSSYNIGKFISMLVDSFFFSPHKSHFINLHFIESISKENLVKLKDETHVPLAKIKRTLLIEKMKIL